MWQDVVALLEVKRASGYEGSLNFGKCNTSMEELRGVLESLQLHKHLGFNVVELHVDSLVVANILIRRQKTILIGWSLVQMIRRLL